jgi:hypothetical protein
MPVGGEPYMSSTKNLIEPKLYRNPTKNLIDPKLYIMPTKNVLSDFWWSSCKV